MIPWSERINMLSINPLAGKREDVLRMAADLSEAHRLLAMWWAANSPPTYARLRLETNKFLGKMALP